MLIFVIATVLFADTPGIDDFEWLAGCWENKEGDHGYEEQWMKPKGDMILGASRTVRNGKVVEYEFLQIVAREDGVFYVARPSGQNSAEFKLMTLENGKAVFENLQHDFPQRIIYEYSKNGALPAVIEGAVKGENRRIDFPMVRASCDARSK